jgi:hypothetical protein
MVFGMQKLFSIHVVLSAVLEMELVDAIRDRRSIRKYKNTPVSKDDIEYILEAGGLAPSWANW